MYIYRDLLVVLVRQSGFWLGENFGVWDWLCKFNDGMNDVAPHEGGGGCCCCCCCKVNFDLHPSIPTVLFPHN